MYHLAATASPFREKHSLAESLINSSKAMKAEITIINQ
jgi:hypothetical protein